MRRLGLSPLPHVFVAHALVRAASTLVSMPGACQNPDTKGLRSV
jgi:hypothetical protein